MPLGYIELEPYRKEDQVSQKEILKVLNECDGLSCEEIAELLDKIPHSVQKVLRVMEIKGDVVPRMRRETDRRRVCCYFLPSSCIDTPPNKVVEHKKPATKKQPQSKSKTVKKSNCGGCYIKGKEYKPPFVDADGKHYPSFNALVSELQLDSERVRYRLRIGAIGAEGKPPHGEIKGSGLFPQKYHPPYVDADGNQFSSYTEGAKFHGVSISTLRRWVYKGIIGCKGNPPISCCRSAGRKLTHLPPFIDQLGNIYHSQEEIQTRFGITRKKLQDWIHKGRIGSNGNLPSQPRQKKAVTDGVTVYESINDAAEAMGMTRSGIKYRIKNNKDGWRYCDGK